VVKKFKEVQSHGFEFGIISYSLPPSSFSFPFSASFDAPHHSCVMSGVSLSI
jgi:hypothetical protein